MTIVTVSILLIILNLLLWGWIWYRWQQSGKTIKSRNQLPDFKHAPPPPPPHEEIRERYEVGIYMGKRAVKTYLKRIPRTTLLNIINTSDNTDIEVKSIFRQELKYRDKHGIN